MISIRFLGLRCTPPVEVGAWAQTDRLILIIGYPLSL